MKHSEPQPEGKHFSNDRNMTSLTASFNPAPPSFDPLTPSLTSTSTSAATIVSKSVVPDLTRVYENLTQSKTPDLLVPPPSFQTHHNKSDEQHAQQYPLPRGIRDSSHLQQRIEHASNHQNQRFSSDQGSRPVTLHPHSRQEVVQYGQQDVIMPRPVVTSANTSSSFNSPPPVPLFRADDERGYSSGGSVDSSKVGGKKRKGATKRRKDDKKEKDGRWTKRFTWPEDLHRDFVAAIFDVGLKHSSPATVLEQMAPHHQVTTERVKSHLQKYRLHRQKSKQDFMTDYEATMRKLQQSGYEGMDALAGGKVAAHVAFATMTNQSTTAPLLRTKAPSSDSKQETGLQPDSTSSMQVQADEPNQNPSIDILIFPKLTEDEKKLPIGTSIGFLMGLFMSLKQQLEAQRQLQSSQSPPVLVKKETPANHQNEKEPPMHQPIHQYHDTAIAAAAVAAAVQGIQGGHVASAELEQQGLAAYDSFVKTLHSSPPKDDEAVLQTPTGPLSIVPQSTRCNLEENNLMKQEMRSQMALQHKMRAMKEQEQNKYKVQLVQGSNSRSDSNDINFRQPRMHPQSYTQQDTTFEIRQDQAQLAGGDALYVIPHEYIQGDAGEHEDHNAGEEPEVVDPSRPHNLSLGEEDDFWNSDVVDDDQLFEFLMDDT